MDAPRVGQTGYTVRSTGPPIVRPPVHCRAQPGTRTHICIGCDGFGHWCAGSRSSVVLIVLSPEEDNRSKPNALDRIRRRPSPSGLRVAPGSCMASRALSPPTVLLVDDDRSVRAIVTRFLAKDGVVVITESDGRTALEIGRRYGRVLDLLITDVQMPGQDGITLALELRALIPNLRVLFITGYWSSRLEALEQTGMRCLIEPFTERQLISAVRKLMPPRRLAGQRTGPD